MFGRGYTEVGIYIYGSLIVTRSFPKGNWGCKGWLKPTTVTEPQGLKAFWKALRVIVGLPAMPVWRDISSDEEVKEREFNLFFCCPSFLPITVCLQDPYSLSDKQLSYLDVAPEFREKAGFLAPSPTMNLLPFWIPFSYLRCWFRIALRIR